MPVMDPIDDQAIAIAPPETATPRPTMRLVGFLTAGFGGLLICVGALMPWVRTSLEGLPTNLSPTYYGIDIADGVVVLVLGAVVLICVLVARLTGSRLAQRACAVVAIVASLIAMGVTIATLVTADSRFQDTAVDDVLTNIDSPTADERAQVDQLIDLQLAAGPFAAIGGAILGIAGGAMLVSGASRSEADGDSP
jgi:hypothetical protein